MGGANKNMKPKPLEHTVSRDEFVDAIVNKDLRHLRRFRDQVGTCVDGISPIYREFVYRIISCNSIKLDMGPGGSGLCETEYNGLTKLFSKRASIKIHSDFSSSTFCHELGHAVDDFYGCDQALSIELEIEPGKTLFDIYTEEFLDHHIGIYDCVIDYYWDLSEKRIGKERTDLIRRHLPLYELLFKNKKEDISDEAFLAARKRIHKNLDRLGFVDAYCRFYEAGIHESTQQFFGPINDSLSSLYDIGILRLRGHHRNYYSGSFPVLTVSEVFANLFRTELLIQRNVENVLLRFFPRTIAGFQKIFEMAYKHFMEGVKYPIPSGVPFDDNALYIEKRWPEARKSASDHVALIGDGGRPMDEESKRLFEEVRPIFALQKEPEEDKAVNVEVDISDDYPEEK